MTSSPRLILASASPRRQELLTAVGLDVTVMPSDLDEEAEPLPEAPALAAEHLALAKARSVATSNPHAVVIGADTMVVDRGIVLGKPGNGDEATRMLRSLRDREHQVITGVAVVCGSRFEVAHAVTRVRMRNYSEHEIARYIARGEPFDKAGAYAIQDAEFAPAAAWHGCYCNVVGLPLALTVSLVASVAAGLLPCAAPFPAQCDGCPYLQTVTSADR